MCRLDWWGSTHHTTRMSTQGHVLPSAQWPSLALFSLCPSHSPIPPLPPSSCPHLPTGREAVTTRGIQLTSVTVSSVSFALTRRQWVMCLRHKLLARLRRGEADVRGIFSSTLFISRPLPVCTVYIRPRGDALRSLQFALLAARHPQTLHWEAAEIDAPCRL